MARESWRVSLEWLQRPVLFAPVLLLLGFAISAGVADRGLPANDEGALLTAAAKILRGAVFYRDIDAYWFPGAAYLLAFAMGIFGEHLSVARALAAIVFAGVSLSLYLAALQLLDRGRAALFGLSLLSFKFLAWPGYTAYMYADLAFAFACGGVALLIDPEARSRRRLLLAGACIGASIASKQNLGFYVAGVAGVLLLFPEVCLRVPRREAARRRSELAAFGAGLALPWLPLAGYLAWQGVLPEMAYSGLIRPFTGYLPTSGVAFATPLAWWELGALRDMNAFPYFAGPYWSMLVRAELPGSDGYSAYWMAGELFTRCLYTSLPVVFAMAVWRWVRAVSTGRVSAEDRRRIAFAAFAFAAVLSAFPRADFYHVIGVYPAVLLLLFSLRRRRGASLGELIAVGSLLAISGALMVQHASRAIYEVELERAHLRLSPFETFLEPVVRFIREEVGPDEPIFVYGHEAYYYFLSDRFGAWSFSQLYPGQAGGDDGRALVELLEAEPPKLVVSGLLSWPGMPALPSYTPMVVGHLNARYRLDDRVFRRHWPRGGRVPPGWTVSVLRPVSSAPQPE